MQEENIHDSMLKNILGHIRRSFGKVESKISSFKEDEAILKNDIPPAFLGKALLNSDDNNSVALIDAQASEIIMNSGNEFWIAGNEDGKRGQRKVEINNIAHGVSYFIRDNLKSLYEGQVKAIKSKKKIFEDCYTHRKLDYENRIQYLKQLTICSRLNPRNFSLFLEIIYIIVALLLIIADIPLALKLTQRGFDLDIGVHKISEFFINPLLVIKQNWEVFIMAGGIALCSIFIKIFWDSFVERPTIATEVTAEEYELSIKRKRKPYKFVLGLVLATIFFLGVFRHAWLTQESERLIAMENSSGWDDITYNVNQNGQSNNGDESRAFTLRSVISPITFIAITLMFPIVGGICTSLGFNCRHNRKELSRATKSMKTAEGEYLKVAEDKFTIEENEARWEESLLFYKTDEFATRVKELLLNYYAHGYERGYLQVGENDISNDLFIQAEELRRRIVAHKIIDAVQNGEKIYQSDKPSFVSR